MKFFKKTKILIPVFAAAVFLSGCENSNIFSWTHAQGGDSSVVSLLSDGQKAENDGDYEEAIEYYDKILKKDPDNSEALYGKASAELKNAGLELSELVSNMINEDTQGTQDLISDLNFEKLEAGAKEAKDALETITSGEGDGTIPADDPDVNLNLAITRAIWSASYLINEYNVKVKDDFTLENLPEEGIDSDDEEKVIGELDKAIDNLKTSGMDTTEIENGFDDFKTEIDGATK
ncbi:MAG: tetratricopeptide repeat protein [Elusimicrobiota bacterium]